MSFTALYDEVWLACERTVRVNECDRKQAVRQRLAVRLAGSKQMIVIKWLGLA
jgi:hypothetical protein